MCKKYTELIILYVSITLASWYKMVKFLTHSGQAKAEAVSKTGQLKQSPASPSLIYLTIVL